MAKAPRLTARATFISDKETNVIEDIDVRFLPLRPGGLQFMHLEKKGKKWFLFQTEGGVFDENLGTIEIIRCEAPLYRPFYKTPDERCLPITRYTVLTPINCSPFYHLDELDDHTYRICHSFSPFKDKTNYRDCPFNHRDLIKIVLEYM